MENGVRLVLVHASTLTFCFEAGFENGPIGPGGPERYPSDEPAAGCLSGLIVGIALHGAQTPS